MKKIIKSLFLTIVVIGFFVVGKNVNATTQPYTYTSGLYRFYIKKNLQYGLPLTPQGYGTFNGSYQQNDISLANYTNGLQNRADFILSDWQHYAEYTFHYNTPYKITIVYGMYPKDGRVVYMENYSRYINNSEAKVRIRVDGVDIEQFNVEQFWSIDTTSSTTFNYLVNEIYFDCVSEGNLIYITHGESNLTTNNGQYLFVNGTPYSSTVGENSHIGLAWTTVEDYTETPDVTGIEKQQQKTNQELQKSSSFLKNIRDKLKDFKDSFDEKMNNLISKVQGILENMGQSVSGLVQDIKNGVNGILQFISNNILGLDDIDDTLQDFVDDIDDNEVMGDIHDFLTSPVGLLNYISDPTPGARCQDLGTSMFNKEIVIPSGCFFWQRQDVQGFKNFWNWLFGGFLIFSLGFKYFKVLHNALDPTKDDLGGLNV